MARLETLIIEGWRGICQSYAMVNQHQILQLLNSGLTLYHDDVPFWQPSWKVDTKTTGFTEEETRRIFSLPPSPRTRIPNSALFRIQHPLNFADDPRVDKIFIFAVNELQHLKWQLPSRQFHNARGNPRYHIVTPSAWARQGILNEGFADWQVSVVPHGVDTSVYFPESAQYRQAVRARLGVQQHEVLLFSAGSMTPSKGVDVCLHLYARLRRQNPKVRLMLKDAGPTYGITVFDFLQKFVARNPGLLTSEDLTALLIAPSEITQRDLADLYRATDLYVSTYRAEGFNLMALEARHCGTKIMVTQGGASDAYANPATDLLVPAERVENAEGVWLEPRIDAATALAQQWIATGYTTPEARTNATSAPREMWTWRWATEKLTQLFASQFAIDSQRDPLALDAIDGSNPLPKIRSPKRFAIFCDGGLGNRFNSLFSGLALASHLGVEPEIYWPLNNWCAAPLSDLFANPPMATNRLWRDMGGVVNGMMPLLHDAVTAQAVGAQRFVVPYQIQSIAQFVSFFQEQALGVVYYPALIPPCVSEADMQKAISSLRLRDEIVESVTSFLGLHGLNTGFYGVHLRRTDLQLGFSDEELAWLFTRFPDERFFVCSDNPSAEEFVKQFSNVCIREKRHGVGKQRPDAGWTDPTQDLDGRLYASNVFRGRESIAEALVDMAILGCSTLIGRTGSTFVAMAERMRNSHFNELCERRPPLVVYAEAEVMRALQAGALSKDALEQVIHTSRALGRTSMAERLSEVRTPIRATTYV
jgi:glycosyltransferase involved in cell wall biosynthesis